VVRILSLLRQRLKACGGPGAGQPEGAGGSRREPAGSIASRESVVPLAEDRCVCARFPGDGGLFGCHGSPAILLLSAYLSAPSLSLACATLLRRGAAGERSVQR